ncbi:MAG: hypothetical protein ACFE9Q_08955 [Candidatus Hodarchaeota archaeon]
MVVNQLLILILLSFGLLIISFIIGITGIIKLLKKKSEEYYILIILIVGTMIFLIPVILGILQHLVP